MLRFQNILYFEKCSRKKFLIILHHAGDLQQLLLGPWNGVCHALRECRSEEVVYKILGDSNPRDNIGRTFDSSAIGVKSRLVHDGASNARRMLEFEPATCRTKSFLLTSRTTTEGSAKIEDP